MTSTYEIEQLINDHTNEHRDERGLALVPPSLWSDVIPCLNGYDDEMTDRLDPEGHRNVFALEDGRTFTYDGLLPGWYFIEDATAAELLAEFPA